MLNHMNTKCWATSPVQLLYKVTALTVQADPHCSVQSGKKRFLSPFPSVVLQWKCYFAAVFLVRNLLIYGYTFHAIYTKATRTIILLQEETWEVSTSCDVNKNGKKEKNHSSAVSVVLFGTWLRVNRKTSTAIHQRIYSRSAWTFVYSVGGKISSFKCNSSVCNVSSLSGNIFLYVELLFQAALEGVKSRKCALDTKTNRRVPSCTGMCAVWQQSRSYTRLLDWKETKVFT